MLQIYIKMIYTINSVSFYINDLHYKFCIQRFDFQQVYVHQYYCYMYGELLSY